MEELHESLVPDTAHLTARPGAVREKASLVHTSVTALRTRLSRAEEQVSAAGRFWQGEAAQAHAECWESAREEAFSLLDQLDLYAQSLEAQAGSAPGAQSGPSKPSRALPEDLLS